MIAAPHLVPAKGVAADLAAHLRKGLPVLETDRCTLRAPVLADAAVWIAIMAADTEGHMGGPFHPDDAFNEFAATVGLWLLRGHGLWTVTDKAGIVLGFVLVGFEPGDQEPELGFLFSENARGKGYATEAAAAARRHALDVLRLPSLVSYIAPRNTASQRLAQRLGARLDGFNAYCNDPQPSQVWRHAPLHPGRSA